MRYAQTEKVFGYQREQLLEQEIEILVPERKSSCRYRITSHLQARQAAAPRWQLRHSRLSGVSELVPTGRLAT